MPNVVTRLLSIALLAAATGCANSATDCLSLGECAPSGSTGAGGADAGAPTRASSSATSSSGTGGKSSSGAPMACDAGAPDLAWAAWPMPNPAGALAPNAVVYDVATPGVVVDTVTGLWWQRAVDAGKLDWPSAKAYCEGLSLAGHDDWRFPTRVELVSIVDFTTRDPAIDATAFPGTPSEGFWSASRVAGAASAAWYVDFGAGSTYSFFVDDAERVRCVR